MMWLLTRNGFILAIALISTLTALFWFTDLDIWVSGWFYHAEAANPWYEEDFLLWAFMYQMGPVISIFIAVGSILIIFISKVKKSWEHYKVQAFFVLLCFVVGPGLLVNALFKDNWGRPRPASVVEFSGPEAYVPPGYYNTSGDGKSFPSGHSSVGFAIIAFYFIWRRRHKYLAQAALITSLVMGGLMGAARIAAGAHFLSDVFWSMFITFLVSAGLYKLFHEKLDKQLVSTQSSSRDSFLYGLIAFLVLSIGLYNWPNNINRSYVVPYQTGQVIEVNGENLRVELVPTPNDNLIQLKLISKGFGFPGSDLSLLQSQKASALHLDIIKKGLFTEVEGTLTIMAPLDVLDRVQVSQNPR